MAADLTYQPGFFQIRTDGNAYVPTGVSLVIESGGTLDASAGTNTLGAITGTSILVTAGLRSSGATGAGIGYATGAGGAVTQITSAATGVTLNKLSGAITTVTQNIAAGAEAQFTVSNTTVAAGDTVIVNVASGSTGGTTIAAVTAVAANSFQITLTNLHASVAETGVLVLNFTVIKGVSA